VTKGERILGIGEIDPIAPATTVLISTSRDFFDSGRFDRRSVLVSFAVNFRLVERGTLAPRGGISSSHQIPRIRNTFVVST
jgi:hypothetical protein